MADTQITSTATSDVPKEYKLPSSVEFTLKAVNASFDGSGAAGAFLPCVTILSDSGHVIARAVDQAVEVGAGDDAEVSWFPGVKHAANASAGDMFSPWQCVSVFNITTMGAWLSNMTTNPTVDAACLHAGFIKSDGSQGAYFATRFALGPFGGIWGFNLIYRKGPTYADIWGYLASIPEDDPGFGFSPDTGVLQEIDTLNYKLAFKVGGYNAVLTRNNLITVGVVQPSLNPFNSNALRIMGSPGAAFTTTTSDASGTLTDLDGGPGMYALKLVAEDHTAPSTGYQMDIQALSASREDWAFG